MKKPGIAALLLALVLPAMAFAKGLPQIQPATAIKIINKAMDKKWGKAVLREGPSPMSISKTGVTMKFGKTNRLVSLGLFKGPTQREFKVTEVGVRGRMITQTGVIDLEKSVPKKLSGTNRIMFSQPLR